MTPQKTQVAGANTMCAMNSETAPDGVIETRGWVTRYDWVVETKHFLNQRLPGAWQGRRETDQTRLADGTSLD